MTMLHKRQSKIQFYFSTKRVTFGYTSRICIHRYFNLTQYNKFIQIFRLFRSYFKNINYLNRYSNFYFIVLILFLNRIIIVMACSH